MWEYCPLSCTSYSTCGCDAPTASDLNCTCGDMAAAGFCETNLDLTANCTYTCTKRLDPTNMCTPVPKNIVLPGNTKWLLSSGPNITIFGSNSGFLQSALVKCTLGYISINASRTGLHICDPFTPNDISGNWYKISPDLPSCIRKSTTVCLVFTFLFFPS